MAANTRAAGERPRVVVVGCGFGGLAAARGLRRAPVSVTVVDRRNYHLFQPLLYQVASAALTPAEIAVPIRRVLRGQRNAVIVLGEVTGIDPRARRVHLREGESLRYDYLVLAAGATDHYFGHDAWRPLAPGLKTLEGALDMRSRMLLSFEAAELETDTEARRERLTFVVIGGGPTGVELAGAIKELAVDVISRDFQLVDTRTTRVVLIEGGPRLLPAMSPASSARAKRDLERMGVEVILGAMVTEVGERGVKAGDLEIRGRNLIWAAGVKANPLGEMLGVKLDRGGRVPVGPDLGVPEIPEVFVIGDLAAAPLGPGREGLVPGVAQGAIQEGGYVAALIASLARGAERTRARPFRYRDKGTMATIGRSRAVADLGGRCIGGFVAWLVWCLVHIAFLIGFRNRVVTMLSWMQSYFFFARGSRLITGERDLGLKRPARDPGAAADP